MTLDELYIALVNANSSGQLNLVPGVLASGPIADFYQSLTSKQPFIISASSIEKSADGKTVSIKNGTAPVLGIVNLPIEMSITQPDNYFVSTLNGILVNGSWDIAGISWFSIGNPFVTINASDSQNPVTGIIGGDVSIGTPLQLQMQLPIVLDQWVLEASFLKDYPSISYFSQLLGIGNISNALPPPLNVFTDIGVSNISVVYDADAGEVSSIGVILQTSQPWPLFSNLTLNDLEISLAVSNPGNSENSDTDIMVAGYFNIGEKDPVTGKYPNTIKAAAYYAPFAMTVSLAEGTIQLGDLITMFIPSVKLDLKSEIDGFFMEINPNAKEYILNCDIKSDWTFFTIDKPNLSLSMTGLGLAISSQQGTIAGTITGVFHIGPNTPKSGVDLTMFAAYDSSGWSFGASTGANESISLGDIASSFLQAFGMDNIPSWVTNDLPKICNVNFLATLPDDSQQPASYQVKGDVEWQLNFGSFDLTLTADIDITYSNGKASGTITGTADATEMLGLTFIVGYQFGTPDTEIYLKIPQLSSTIDYKSNAQFDVIDIKFDKISLGEIISTLLSTVSPGFTLPSPWDILNSIDLSGFEFSYTRYKTSSQSTIVATIPINVDLGFINIQSLKITKDGSSGAGGSGVYIFIEGTFLGLPIEGDSPLQKDGKGSDATNMPQVPGMGSQFFDLSLLAMGQHVSMYDTKDLNTVDASIIALKNAFTSSSDPNSTEIPVPASSTKPGTLIFDQNSNWLIGTDFKVAKFYRIAAVFNDPNMYGLLVGVDPTADYFKNLQFEILYKKINDTIGMYQLDLQLPDEFRHLEFGEVSITLPIIGIKVYTNGNFYLDFGFPASITDFSRSFSVQVFPFVGYGGFYFGYLSGATSTSVPVTTCGTFNPVIELGLGLSIGLGKTVDEGILKAGLSITAVGIFQGVLGFFHANPNLQTTDGTYYKLQGTFGITGHLYGEINFAIISARLDVLAYAYITILIESYKPIPISLIVGVSVSLSVKINLGLFSIHISLHFSATISASFTIGNDTSASAPWNLCPAPGAKGLATRLMLTDQPAPPAVILKWQPIIPATVVPLDLVFIPQLTVSGESGSSGPQYVAMLYVNSGTADNSLAALTEGVLYWAVNAMIGNTSANTGLSWLNDQPVSADQISELLCYFNTRPDNVAPFNYQNTAHHDIKTFFSEYFILNIRAVDPTLTVEMEASVFSMLPELILNTIYNGKPGSGIDFTTQSMTGTQNYISDISNLLASMGVDYQSQITQDYFASSLCQNMSDPDYESQPDLSFPTFLFTDFISLVAKQALQGALDYLKQQNGQTAKVSITVSNAVSTTVQGIGGMASRFMLHGLRLPSPPVASSGVIRPLYMLTGQQIAIPPTLNVKDSYVVTLQSPGMAWVKMVNAIDNILSIPIDNNEIQHILDIATITLAPSLISGPSPIINYNDSPQSFSLGASALWQYPGDYYPGISNSPTIWKLPSSLNPVFAAGGNPAFSINTITATNNGSTKGQVANSTWGTALSFSLQKISASGGLVTPLSANMYNLVGADDAGIVFLENLISYLNTHNDSDGINTIQQIQVLYQPDPVDNSNGGYISAANGQFKTAIVQANLSTETNPTEGMLLMTELPEQQAPQRDYNTLNIAGDFIKLLWECSIVRSGGFYFYYNTDDNKGLPDILFGDKGIANLTLVITYDNLIVSPFVNSVLIGDQIDTAKTSVYAQSPEVTTRVATILPGCVGYEMSRNYPGVYNTPTQPVPTKADDQVYLQYQFNLVGASLPSETAFQNLLPAGPTDPMSEEEVQKAKDTVIRQNVEALIWNYNAVIPYYKFVQPGGTNPQYPNPYAGIGANVQIALNWQDMFGNIPPSGAAPIGTSMQLLYSDTIVAVSQWPSVSLFYLFELNGNAPVLDLNFLFNVTRYAGDGAKNNAQIDLLTYMKLFYQLSNGDMTVNFITTIEDIIDGQGKATSLIHTLDIGLLLSGFINPIIAMLQTVASGGGSVIIQPYIISTNITVSNITKLPEIYSLAVSLTLERIAHLDPAFANVPGVASATTIIQPLSKDPSHKSLQDKQMLSLGYFASNFEKAFLNQPTQGLVLKLATGTNMTKGNSDTTDTPPLWMVRFDTTGSNGIKYGFNNQPVFYFAPIPLATSLQSFAAKINQYQQAQPYPFGNPVTKNFSSIDMDGWASQFLQAVDKFLSPAYTVPAFLMTANNLFSGDPDYLQEILDSKKAIAEAIEGTIDFIIDPCNGQSSPPCTSKNPANIGNAQEKWKQQMLKQLSNAYRYVASVQTTATISSDFNGVNNDPPASPYVPWLYGNMAGEEPTVTGTDKAPKSTEYSLSTTKVPIGNGDSWLTYLFEAKDAAESRSFSFGDMKYKVSHLEFGIGQVPEMGDYLASSWLAFIIPLDGDIDGVASPLIGMGDVGKTVIPVPLRSYPTPPSVSVQNSDYPVNDPAQQKPVTVGEARTWDYTYTYENPSAAQDTVITEVQYNVTQSQQSAFLNAGASNQPLYEALAQFLSIYPAISSDLDSYLSQLTPVSLSKSSPIAINARFALKAFISIVNQVAEKWAQTNQVNSRKPKASLLAQPEVPPPPYTLSYTITESAQDLSGYLQISAVANNGQSANAVIKVNIKDYLTDPVQGKNNTWIYYTTDKNGTKTYLSYDDRNSQSSRTVILPGLDILNAQNAWSSVAVIRNEELLQNNDGSWQTTNPYFIYQTPQVKFYNKLIPLLNCDAAIDIATIGTQNYPVQPQRTLAQQMLALCDALTENLNAVETGYMIKMECDYTYLIPGTNLPVQMPVIMLTPTEIMVADNGKSIAELLTGGIRDWLKNKPQLNGGQYDFAFTAYSATDSYVPVLQIPFYLGLNSISEA